MRQQLFLRALPPFLLEELESKGKSLSAQAAGRSPPLAQQP
jgi:hypothetical protein